MPFATVSSENEEEVSQIKDYPSKGELKLHQHMSSGQNEISR